MSVGTFRVLSELVERAKLMARAGVTYGGKRDTYEVLGYKQKLVFADYWERYLRGGLAKTIVEILPETTWRGGATVQEVEDPARTTAFEAEWEKFAERLSVWSIFEDADRLSGIGEFACVFIGAGDKDPREPLQGLSSTDDIGFLQVYKQDEIDWTMVKINKEIRDPRYGLPEFYALKEDFHDRRARTRDVHWSRILHVPTDSKTNLLFGLPRLQAVWNRLDDLDKVTGGGAEASWQQANPITQFDIDKDLKIDTGDKNLQEMKEQIDELVHNLRRYIRTRGVTMSTRQSQVHDFGNNADAIISQIAGTIKVPKRILLGAEQGELASTQDRANFAERISDRREQFALPVILRPFIQRLDSVGALKAPASWTVKWPEIRNLSQLERTQVTSKMAGVNDPKNGIVVFTVDELRAVVGKDPITDEQLEREAEIQAVLAEAQAELMPEPEPEPEPELDDEGVEGDTRDQLPRAAVGSLPSRVLGEDVDWSRR